jgi:hypothetical protein
MRRSKILPIIALVLLVGLILYTTREHLSIPPKKESLSPTEIRDQLKEATKESGMTKEEYRKLVIK